MISRTLRLVFLVACLAPLAGAAALAQGALPTNDAAVMRANAGTVGIVSGGVDGTYIRIAADLAAVLDDGDRLRVLALIGKGSVGNISDIMFLRGVDIGIVQSDALAYVRREKLFPGVDQSVEYITKLYDEELHILARKDIASLQDLAGKTVNVDVRGSGSAMTVSLVLDALGISAKLANDDQNTALEKLKNGEIAAIGYVTGKPARLFTGIAPDTGLHFLPVAMTPALLDTYLPSSLGHAEYPALVPEGADVETLAVGSVMAAYGWPPNTERYRKVARFVAAFFDKFPSFLKPPRHPKWKEVNLAAQVPGWTRFPAAQEWLRLQTAGGAGEGALRQDFNAFLAQSGGARPAMTDQERAALFQQFLVWQRQRATQ
ncbi:TAXI family TRAP transporter solute-binding subunit [Limobrevibacterium gyesilva]|uniref:TAXI family TRAP transporter solute-binding subunit n=1 Tax=Limobrevibacterium gyesilva TaxID=2991712 RepID=A0AA42CHQ4_9PROT|nr:TAXI family TRAP transporter solute-binding subunit [Limobrevibacterium gyesilva]MCW3475217.1 TAXI family TRAP transporter solute-binding subunit [Limobrevibacterium gyesilva]